MIQEIKVKNFLSFREESVINFEATKDKFAEDVQTFRINNLRLLRCIIIYGYNASGKSNILEIFGFLQKFWTNKPHYMDIGTGLTPFLLHKETPDQPSSFELTFYVEGTKYNYSLLLDREQVYHEKLSYYKSLQPIMLFERNLKGDVSVVHFNSSANADKVSNVIKEEISAKCWKNTSFFVARRQVNATLPIIDKAADWLKNKIKPVIRPNSELLKFAQKEMSADVSIASYLIDFLNHADFNITDIINEEETHGLPKSAVKVLYDLKDLDIEEARTIIREKKFTEFKTYFQHTVENDGMPENYRFLSNRESTGTLRTLGLETILYKAVKENLIVPIDEIETSLHSRLVEKLLYHYLKTPSESQIIVATHNDGLLDLTDDLLRKDSIRFVEKDKSGNSEIYSLTDFNGVNRLTSIRTAYRNKRFGATMR